MLLEELERQRVGLRNRLADAWALRQPANVIHGIENELKAVWTAIEAAEAREQSSPIPSTGAPGRSKPPAERPKKVAVG